MRVKIIIINILIIATIISVVFLSQQKNSQIFGKNSFWGKVVGGKEYIKKPDNWVKNSLFPKTGKEASKRGGTDEKTTKDTNNSILQNIWQGTIGGVEKEIEKIGDSVSAGKSYASEKISNAFCPAPGQSSDN